MVYGVLSEVGNITADDENMKKWEKQKKAEIGEVDVTNALELLLSGKRATIFHSLKTGQYLSMIWGKNCQQTINRKPSDGLSDQEIKLSKILKVSLQGPEFQDIIFNLREVLQGVEPMNEQTSCQLQKR